MKFLILAVLAICLLSFLITPISVNYDSELILKVVFIVCLTFKKAFLAQRQKQKYSIYNDHFFISSPPKNALFFPKITLTIFSRLPDFLLPSLRHQIFKSLPSLRWWPLELRFRLLLWLVPGKKNLCRRKFLWPTPHSPVSRKWLLRLWDSCCC